MICDPTAHVYVWEGGAIARLWGVTTRTVSGDHRGRLMPRDDVEGSIRPDDSHYVKTRLICLENTNNRRGGRVHPLKDAQEIAAWARSHGLAMHCDGARLMNAVVASGVSAAEWARNFDTVSVCFSKGLGGLGRLKAVCGIVREHIRAAHRLRKVLGGGMRQAGVIAAAALYALDHHVERLADDHENASKPRHSAVQEPPRG